ncbi:MAG TPA: FGGY family carbohydrate kinase [Devosia sp.]|nr:FGGY family carbohydrate kinase [Devosia sp.]
MLVGIDIGTQSLKVLVLDGQLRVRGEASAPYETIYPRHGWAEQDANDWLRALRPTIGAALAEAECVPDAVTAIGIAGQLDGCVPVDADGAAIGPAIVWMDRRADAMIGEACARLVRERTGLVPDGTHMAAKIAWVQRHDPETARGTVTWHQPVSFVVAALTGAAVMDPALASTTMLTGIDAPGWDARLCEAFGVDAARLPAMAAAGSVAGVLGARGAALTGLSPGCRVAVGTGDDFSNPLGSGIAAPGTIGVTLGTGEVVSAVAAEPVRDAAQLVETRRYVTGQYQLGNPGWLSGGAVRWLREVIGVSCDADVHALAEKAPAGSDGVLFFPGLSGAMSPVWDAGARASFYGMSSGHDRSHLARALLEGTAFAMRDVVERLGELGEAADGIRLAGGGARSALWAQMRADICGLPVVALTGPDASALGAGVLAAVADRRFASIAEAVAGLPLAATRHEPLAATRAAYDDAYGRYRLLFRQLQPVFGGLQPRW